MFARRHELCLELALPSDFIFTYALHTPRPTDKRSPHHRGVTCVSIRTAFTRHRSAGPERRGLAANLVVFAEQEGVSAIRETRGSELPNEENRPAVFAYVRQYSVQVVSVRKDCKEPCEKSTSALYVEQSKQRIKTRGSLGKYACTERGRLLFKRTNLPVSYYYFPCHPTMCSMIFNIDHSSLSRKKEENLGNKTKPMHQVYLPSVRTFGLSTPFSVLAPPFSLRSILKS